MSINDYRFIMGADDKAHSLLKNDTYIIYIILQDLFKSGERGSNVTALESQKRSCNILGQTIDAVLPYGIIFFLTRLYYVQQILVRFLDVKDVTFIMNIEDIFGFFESYFNIN